MYNEHIEETDIIGNGNYCVNDDDNIDGKGRASDRPNQFAANERDWRGPITAVDCT